MSDATDRGSLETLRAAFASRRFLAMPLAGAVGWSSVAIGGVPLSPGLAARVLFPATGFIFWLGIGLSRRTGEHFMDKARPKSTFDALYLSTLDMPCWRGRSRSRSFASIRRRCRYRSESCRA